MVTRICLLDPSVRPRTTLTCLLELLAGELFVPGSAERCVDPIQVASKQPCTNMVRKDSDIDDTVKMFMTERGDPSALFQPTWACNPQTDAVQIELRFIGKQNAAPGGWICIRPAFENSHEFRYYPPGNTSKPHGNTLLSCRC